MHLYRKYFSESLEHSRATTANIGFPIDDVPSEMIDEESRRLKDISLRSASIHKTYPSASCFTFQNYSSICSSMAFSPNFSLLCVGTNWSYIDVWNCSGGLLRSLKASTELAAIDLNTITSIDQIMENGSHMKRLVGHSGPVSGLCLNRDSSSILSSSFDCTLRLWSTLTFSSLATYRSHAFPIWDCDMSPLGHYFVSGSSDRTARLWNFDYSYPLRMYVGHLSDVDAVKFHPNGCYIGTGGSDKACRLWDLPSGNCVRMFGGHHRSVNCLSFSRNGKWMASGDLGGQLILYDIGEGRIFWKYNVPPSNNCKNTPILSMDFSCEDRFLAVSFGDDRVCIFSTDDLNVSPVEYHTKKTPIYSAKFNHRDVLMCAGPFSPE